MSVMSQRDFGAGSSVLAWLEGVRSGETLPYEAYRSQEVFDLERDRIFTKTWQLFGFTSQLANPGDTLVGEVAGVPLVAVRDKSGGLRAHVNVCRHRANIVVRESGNYSRLQCSYHGWSYDLDGCLQGAPRSDQEPEFDRSRFSLLSASIDSWGPMVFVTLDPDAMPLRDWLGAAASVVEDNCSAFDQLEFSHRSEWDLHANWKAFSENALECYHCSLVHPTIHRLFKDEEMSAVELGENSILLGMPPRTDGDEASRDGKIYQPNAATSYFPFLFPNLMMMADSEGTDSLVVAWWAPVSPTRTRVVQDYLFAPEATEEYRSDYASYYDDVATEDVAIVQAVQRGMEARVLARGKLMVSSEHAVQHFDKLVCGALTSDD